MINLAKHLIGRSEVGKRWLMVFDVVKGLGPTVRVVARSKARILWKKINGIY